MTDAQQSPDDRLDDRLDDSEADVADLLDQAEPPRGLPVEEALEERERIATGDPEEDVRLEDDAAEAAGGDDAD